MKSYRLLRLFTLSAGLAIVVSAGSVRGDTLYVSNGQSNTIEKFSSDGGGTVFANTFLHTPAGLAIDSAGNVYAANVDNTISKFTPAGVGSVFANTGLNNPQGLAFDGAGNLFAANYTNNSIEEYTPGGTPSVFAADTGDHSLLYQPVGLAFDGAGNLYVSNLTFIEKFTPGGGGSLFINTHVNLPQGLAFDSDGNLYVANRNDNSITEFDSTGTYLGTFASGYPDLALPTGIAFDSDGNLYAANVIPSIEAFTPGGIPSVFATDPGDHSVLSEPLFIAIVPEPSALALLGLCIPALFGAAGPRRRTR